MFVLSLSLSLSRPKPDILMPCCKKIKKKLKAQRDLRRVRQHRRRPIESDQRQLLHRALAETFQAEPTPRPTAPGRPDVAHPFRAMGV